MNTIKLITNSIALAVAPFITAVALAGTPIRIDAIKTGLDVAIAKQMIPKEGVLQGEVKQFLKLIIDGSTPEDASEQTGVKLAIIYRLQELGTTPEAEVKPLTVTAPKTTPSSFEQTIEKAAKPVSQTEQSQGLPNANPKAQAEQIWRGLRVADRNGEIRKYSTEGLAVQKMLQRMRWGESLAFASQKTGVAQETVLRLLSLGTEKPVREDTSTIANALVRGLSKANAIGEIGYTSAVSYRVQDVVRRLRRGNGLSVSARYSGVSEKTINRLLELGNYQSQTTASAL